MGWSVEEACLRWLWYFGRAYGLWMTLLWLELLPRERVKVQAIIERPLMVLVYRRRESLWLVR